MRRVSLFFIVTLFFSGLPVTQAQAQEEQPRVLLMDLKNNGLDENLVKTINSLLTVNMTNYTQFNVMSGNDVKQLVALEMEKQTMGCSDDGSCLAEIAGAMGATLVIFGDAGKIDVMLINLSLFNAEEADPCHAFPFKCEPRSNSRKNGAHLRQLMAPVMPKSVAATAAPPPPPRADTRTRAGKKVAAAPATPPPAAEVPTHHRRRLPLAHGDNGYRTGFSHWGGAIVAIFMVTSKPSKMPPTRLPQTTI